MPVCGFPGFLWFTDLFAILKILFAWAEINVRMFSYFIRLDNLHSQGRLCHTCIFLTWLWAGFWFLGVMNLSLACRGVVKHQTLGDLPPQQAKTGLAGDPGLDDLG
jgi:hypothetical protein